MSQVLLLLRNLVRWSGTSDPEMLSDLDKNGFSGVKTLKPGWSGMKGEREQGNGGRSLRDSSKWLKGAVLFVCFLI